MLIANNAQGFIFPSDKDRKKYDDYLLFRNAIRCSGRERRELQRKKAAISLLWKND